MTTVESWDHYSWEEQQTIIEEGQLMEEVSNLLEASIGMEGAWGYTNIIIEKRLNKPGCKSFLTAYLLQKTGLTNIQVNREQINLISTNQYTYTEVKEAFKTILKHPEWIEDFKTEYKERQMLQRFTFEMDNEEIRRYM